MGHRKETNKLLCPEKKTSLKKATRKLSEEDKETRRAGEIYTRALELRHDS
jgi:hypothetical protein